MQQIQQNWIGKQINASTTENPNRNYKIEDYLGSGSQGSVYQGKHIINNFQYNNVAIKIQSCMSDQEIQFLKSVIQYQNQYESKQQNLQNYNPSQIVRIFDFFQYNDNWILVMELGTQDLYKFIQQKQQHQTYQLGQILKQITKSIQFLHDKQLIHRDIKPENYIQIGDEYKLIDFGLITTQFRSKTANVGTVLYQAPELISNLNNYTQAIDIWSLGCLFYEILCGSTLIQGTNQDQIQKMILNHKQDSKIINQRINLLDCNKDIKDMIVRMLDPNPQNRLKTQQIIEILDSKFTLQKFPIINQFSQQINIPNAQNNQFPIQYQQIPQQQQGILMQFNQQNQQSQSQQLMDIQKQLSQQQTLLESITTNFKLIVGLVENSKLMVDEIKKEQEQQKIEINQIKNDLKAEIQNIIVDKLELYQNNIFSKLDKVNEEQKDTIVNLQNQLLVQNNDFIASIQKSIADQIKDQAEFKAQIQKSLNDNYIEGKELIEEQTNNNLKQIQEQAQNNYNRNKQLDNKKIEFLQNTFNQKKNQNFTKNSYSQQNQNNNQLNSDECQVTNTNNQQIQNKNEMVQKNVTRNQSQKQLKKHNERDNNDFQEDQSKNT